MTRAKLAAIAIGALVGVPSAAHAQGAGGFGNGSGPSTGGASGGSGGGMKSAVPEPESPDAGEHLSPRSYKLFDTRRSVNSIELDLGTVGYRKKGSDDPFTLGTGEIRAGVWISTTWKGFYLTGGQAMYFRALDAKSFAFTLLASEFGGGYRLGPLEPEVRFGASLVTLDVFHAHYSAEALSPRVAAGIGIHIGKIRLDIETHSEYLWRWFGPDYLIRGVSLGLRLDVPQPKEPTFTDPPK